MKKITIFLIFIIYLVLAIPSLKKPIEAWEWITYESAKSIIADSVPVVKFNENRPVPFLIHPPVLSYLIASSFSLFGEGEVQSRLPGIIILGINGFLLYLLTKLLSKNEETALIALALYLTNAMAIQGGLSLDFTDGNLMPLSFILFFICFYITKDWPMLKKIFLLSLSFALCLLSKLTTTLAIPLTLLLFGIVSCRLYDGIKLTAGVTFLGSLFFGLIWVLVCMFIHLKLPKGGYSLFELITYPLNYIIKGKGSNPVSELSLNDVVKVSFFVFLKFGPLIFIFAFLDILQRLKNYFISSNIVIDDIMLIFSLIVFFGYLFIQGGTTIFPKYHLPILPFVAIFGARWITTDGQTLNSRTVRTGLLLSILCLPIYFFIVGDYNLLFTKELKMALICGTGKKIFIKILYKSGIYMLIPLTIAWLVYNLKGRNISLKRALCFVLIASQISLSALQGMRPYLVKYYYGFPTKDLEEVFESLAEIDQEKIILAPSFIVARTRCTAIPEWRDRDWSDLKKLKQAISEYRPKAVVYGLYTNTISQLRSLKQDREIYTVLKNGYIRYNIGENVMWLRK